MPAHTSFRIDKNRQARCRMEFPAPPFEKKKAEIGFDQPDHKDPFLNQALVKLSA